MILGWNEAYTIAMCFAGVLALMAIARIWWKIRLYKKRAGQQNQGS